MGDKENRAVSEAEKNPDKPTRRISKKIRVESHIEFY
jgi:hypothetical protein